MALAKAKQLVSSHSVFVFRSHRTCFSLWTKGFHCRSQLRSMTYCSFCQKVKDLFSSLNAKYEVIELDKESDGGSEMQSVLVEWTKQKNVPYVFIGGKLIGGWDSTLAKHRRGKLIPMLQAARSMGPDNFGFYK